MRAGQFQRGRSHQRAQSRILHLERRDPFPQRDHRLGDLALTEACGDVLGAIDVPRFDREQDRSFGPGAVAWISEPREQCRIVFHNARAPPDFDPPARSEVEQKKVGTIIPGEIADGDVLPVARVIRKAERPLVEHLDEALPAAAMLDIGRTGRRDGAEERRVKLADDGCKLAGHPLRKTCGDTLLIGARRAALRLRAPRGGGEDEVAIVAHGVLRGACEPGRGELTPLAWPSHEHSHFQIDDNAPLSEVIIAVVGIIWIVSMLWQSSSRSPSTAVLPKPGVGSGIRRPPSRARSASLKRGSGCDFSTAPRARSASPRPGTGFWRVRDACSPISTRSSAPLPARAARRALCCASPRRSYSGACTWCRS